MGERMANGEWLVVKVLSTAKHGADGRNTNAKDACGADSNPARVFQTSQGLWNALVWILERCKCAQKGKAVRSQEACWSACREELGGAL